MRTLFQKEKQSRPYCRHQQSQTEIACAWIQPPLFLLHRCHYSFTLWGNTCLVWFISKTWVPFVIISLYCHCDDPILFTCSRMNTQWPLTVLFALNLSGLYEIQRLWSLLKESQTTQYCFLVPNPPLLSHLKGRIKCLTVSCESDTI